MGPSTNAQVSSLLSPSRTPRLGLFVGVSVGLHVAVAALAVLLGNFDRSPRIVLDQEPIKASLVRLGKERDQRLLPRQQSAPPPPKEVKAPPKPPEPVPVPTPVPAVAPVAVPVPGVKPQPAPTPQAGTKTGDETQKPRSLADAFSRASSKPEELEGAEDGDPFGDSAVQEGERYYGALRAQIRRYYDVSQTISDQERLHLRAEVLIRIGRAGELLDAKVAKRSGNELFDSSVLAAARRASPFSPPPDHLRANLDAKGILLEFRP